MFNVLQKTLEAHKPAVNKKRPYLKHGSRQGVVTLGCPRTPQMCRTQTHLKNVFQRKNYIGQKTQSNIKKEECPYGVHHTEP